MAKGHAEGKGDRLVVGLVVGLEIGLELVGRVMVRVRARARSKARAKARAWARVDGRDRATLFCCFQKVCVLNGWNFELPPVGSDGNSSTCQRYC